MDAAADGALILWEAETGELAQTWASYGWDIFKEKAGTLQCTDVVTKCTIDAQSDWVWGIKRRVLSVYRADGVYLTGLVITGGYLSVSWGDARGSKRRQMPAPYSLAAPLQPPTPPKTPSPSHP